jgi:hypothetical protein
VALLRPTGWVALLQPCARWDVAYAAAHQHGMALFASALPEVPVSCCALPLFRLFSDLARCCPQPAGCHGRCAWRGHGGGLHVRGRHRGVAWRTAPAAAGGAGRCSERSPTAVHRGPRMHMLQLARAQSTADTPCLYASAYGCACNAWHAAEL